MGISHTQCLGSINEKGDLGENARERGSKGLEGAISYSANEELRHHTAGECPWEQGGACSTIRVREKPLSSRKQILGFFLTSYCQGSPAPCSVQACALGSRADTIVSN